MERKVILAAIAALGIVFGLNHAGFISYSASGGVVAGIRWGRLAYNLLCTPAMLMVFAASFYGLGRYVVRLAAGNDLPPEYGIVYATAAGMAVFQLALMAAGAVGLLYLSVVLIVLAAGCAGAVFHRAELRAAAGTIRRKEVSWQTPLRVVTAMALFYAGIAALSYPTSWDALAYHLPVARLYAGAHRIVPAPFFLEKQCTAGMEMLTSAALLVSNPALAQTFSLLAGMLLLAALFAFARKRLGETGAWAAVAFLAVQPAMLYTGGTAGNDVAVALFGALCVIAVSGYFETGRQSWLNFAGACAGMAAMAKMTGLVAVAWVLGVLGFLYASGRIRARDLGGPALLCALFAFGVYLKNFLLTGNPVFPYLSSVFKSHAMPFALAVRQAAEAQATTGVPRTLINFLTLPFSLIARPGRFQFQPQFAVASVSALLVARIFMRKRPARLELLLSSYVFLFFLVWFFSGSQVWRYALLALPFLGMLAVQWWNDLNSTGVKIVFGALLALNLVPLLSWNVNNNLFAVLALPSRQEPGADPRERYLEKTLDHYRTYAYANRHLPPGARVFLFREIRGFYLEVPYVWGDPVNQSVVAYENYLNAGELGRELARLGITHVIVNTNIYPPGRSYYDERTGRLMQEFIDSSCVRMYASNGVVLYTVK